MSNIKVGDRVRRTLPSWNRDAIGVVDSHWYGLSGHGFKVRFEDNSAYRENWYTNQLELIEEENEVPEVKRPLVGPKPEPVQVPPEPAFASPFHADGEYVADANNRTALVVSSIESSTREDREFAEYVVEALNAYVPPAPPAEKTGRMDGEGDLWHESGGYWRCTSTQEEADRLISDGHEGSYTSWASVVHRFGEAE